MAVKEKELPHAPPEDATGPLAELRRSVRDASIELRASANPQIEDELREALEGSESENERLRAVVSLFAHYHDLEDLRRGVASGDLHAAKRAVEGDAPPAPREKQWETYLVSYERAVAKTYPNRNIITPISMIREHYEAGTPAIVAAESADEKSPTDS